MAKTHASLKFTGKIQEFKRFVNSKIATKILEQEVEKATLKNVLLIQDEISQKIVSSLQINSICASQFPSRKMGIRNLFQS